MGAPTGVDAEAMRLQNEEIKKENDELRSKLQSLTEKVLILLGRCPGSGVGGLMRMHSSSNAASVSEIAADVVQKYDVTLRWRLCHVLCVSIKIDVI